MKAVLFIFCIAVLLAWIGLQCQAERILAWREIDTLEGRVASASDSKATVRSFITPTVENTFIFSVLLYSNEKKADITLKGLMRGFEDRMGLTYQYPFYGFAIALKNARDILRIEAMNLGFLHEIEQDSILYLDQQEPQVLADVSAGDELVTASWKHMNVPDTMQGAYMGGEGVTVAVLDQGIRYLEKAFVVPGQPCTKENRIGCRVKKIFDFIAYEERGIYYEAGSNEEPVYDGTTEAYGNHGNAMAALIGGARERGVQGMVPRVTFYDFRIADASRQATKTRIMSAIGLATRHAVDVINVSMGGLKNTLLALRAPLLKPNTHNEILVATSVGNSGQNEFLFQANYLGMLPSALANGCFENPIYKRYTVHLQWYKMGQRGRDEVHEVDAFGNDAFDLVVNKVGLHIIPMKQDTLEDPTKVMAFRLLKTKFVLLACKTAADCLAQARILHVHPQVLGILFASSVLLHANLFKFISKPVGKLRNIPEDFEEQINSMFYAKGTIQLASYFVSDEAPKPAALSSWGPSNLFHLSPDISLIGSGIRTYRYERRGRPQYKISHGSSYSSASFAAASVLYIKSQRALGQEVHTQQLFHRARNTAIPAIDAGQTLSAHPNMKDLAYPVLKQGAGLIQVEAMIKTKVYIEPSKIEWGYCKPQQDCNNEFAQQLTIHNTGHLDVTYRLQHLSARPMRYAPDGNLEADSAYDVKIEFSLLNHYDEPQTLYLKASTSTKLTVTFHLDPSTPPFTFLNGYIQLISATSGSPDTGIDNHLGPPEYGSLSVPYFVLYGDMAHFPVIVCQGDRAAFLTNLEIARVKEKLNPNFPLRNAPEFPLFHEDPPHDFSFRGADKPMIGLCLLFPLKHLAFQLYAYERENQLLGDILAYEKLWPSCYLFLSARKIIIGSKPPSASAFYQGWDGTYMPLGEKTRKVAAKHGYYRICAKAELDIDALHTPEISHEWCSVTFKVGQMA